MADDDWLDPFAEDEAARERERRRAEREARRRRRQESVAEKVDEHRAEEPDERPAPRTARASADGPEPAAAAGRGGRGATPASAPEPAAGAGRAGTRERPAAGSGPSRNTVLARRLAGALGLLVVAGLVAFGVTEVVDRLGGSEPEPAPAPKRVKVENVTIPEGLDHRQIAAVAKDAGLRGSYAKAAKNPPKGFKLRRYGAQGAPSLEGFLFPATYELERKASARDLVARQLDAFRDNLAGVDLSYAKSKNLTVYDVLKIASMVEREVQVPKERRLVASVIYNRLAAGTPLGIDATIRYEDQNYDEQLTESRLNEPTAYNTRINTGLPPTPIGNPGLASIEAAARPAKTDYMYFVVKPCGEGRHVFAKTQAEFERAEAKYQQALEEQGGSPTEC